MRAMFLFKPRSETATGLLTACFACLVAAAVVVGAVPPKAAPVDKRVETWTRMGTGTGIDLARLFPRTADYDFAVPDPGSYQLPALKVAPGGQLLDMNGEVQDLAKVLDGRISLVSFVYLLCADTNGCPLALATLFDVFDGSEAAPFLKQHLQLVTISFDPERDTPEALGSFAYPVLADPKAGRKIDWHFYTSSGHKALQPVLDGFGQAVIRTADSETINHLLRMFLVDRQGRIRNVYGLGMIDPRLLMSDVETLLMEEAGQ